jgi:hypothetical protein
MVLGHLHYERNYHKGLIINIAGIFEYSPLKTAEVNQAAESIKVATRIINAIDEGLFKGFHHRVEVQSTGTIIATSIAPNAKIKPTTK